MELEEYQVGYIAKIWKCYKWGVTHAAAIEALLQAEPDVVDVNRAAEAQLNAERVDAAAIEALL